LFLFKPHSAANHADGDSLHQIEICIAQNEPFRAGRLKIDLHPGMRTLALAVEDYAVAKLRVPDPLPKADTKLITWR